MEREELESRLIDYIDGQLTDEERNDVDRLLSTSEEARVLLGQLQRVLDAMTNAQSLKTVDSLKDDFESALKDEQSRQVRGSQVFFTPTLFRIAASVVLVLSLVMIGYWVNRNIQQEKELVALRAEMEETKHLMLKMLSDDQSASQRMKAVNVAMDITKVDDEIVNALSQAMMKDPNTNVRLAALDALSRFSNDQSVRNLLVNSLATQNDPMVQISLIQLLVKMKEKRVIQDLEKIIDNDETIPAVKDEAYTGILKLS